MAYSRICFEIQNSATMTLVQWSTPQDIKDSFRSASFIENNRVVFNICGNNYRLVVAVAYQIQAVYVKFFGTHAEYDNINAATIEVK